MIARKCILPLLLLTFVSSAAYSQADGKRFLLLRSGRIVEGKVDQIGTDSRINLEQGGYFVVSSDRIEKAFRSRRDVFNYKIAITPLTRKSQNELFYWLLKQDAFDQAGLHLEYLRKFESKLPDFDFKGWHESILKKQEKHVSNPSKVLKTDSDVFRERIESHLVLGCALSGCHKNQSLNQYNLIDSQLSTVRNEASNYETTKKAIATLGQQEFLKYVSSKHANLKRGIYPTATTEYLAIATWVNSLTTPGPVTIEKTQANKNVSTANRSPGQSPHRVPNLGNRPPANQSSNLVKQINERNTGLDANEFVPRDEFDPEIFNRNQKKNWAQTVRRPTPSITVEPAQTPQRLISPDKTRSKN